MITDSISFPMPAPKDFSKKKRGNRTAKLKQCKLDARREQWLSQVKKRGCKDEEAQAVHVSNEGKKTEISKLEVKTGDVRNEEQIHHFSDSDSASNSPNSSILGSNTSSTNFTASSTSGSSSGGSFSGSITGEDDEDCLDDWEALADALTLSDQKQELDKPKPELTNQAVESPKPKQEPVEKTQKPPTGGRAWRPDDAFRPQSLPNLAKQKSFPLGRNYFCKSVVAAAAPTCCPICCEDLDITDSSFHPCGCGFRLCLFCHKRIIEEDGRCPGCRKPYEHEGETTFRLARSCSMITRF